MNKITRNFFALAASMMLFVFNANAQQFFYESFDGLTGAKGGNDGYFDNAYYL